jgi:hypothetical protein
VSYDAPPREAPAFEAPREVAPERDYSSEVPREPAPERDYAAEAPRPEPVETDFARSAPRDDWSPPQRSFSETPPDTDRDVRNRQGESSGSEGNGESVSVPANERQAG